MDRVRDRDRVRWLNKFSRSKIEVLSRLQVIGSRLEANNNNKVYNNNNSNRVETRGAVNVQQLHRVLTTNTMPLVVYHAKLDLDVVVY